MRYEVEQFAYPLHGPPAERRGDIEMVLLQKVRLTELSGPGRTVPLGMTHRRELPAADVSIVARTNGTALLWKDANSNRLLLALQGQGFTLQSNFSSTDAKWQTNQIVLGTAAVRPTARVSSSSSSLRRWSPRLTGKRFSRWTTRPVARRP